MCLDHIMPEASTENPVNTLFFSPCCHRRARHGTQQVCSGSSLVYSAQAVGGTRLAYSAPRRHVTRQLMSALASFAMADVDVQLSQYTMQLVTETLPKETGEWAGWQTTGSLLVCSSEERLIVRAKQPASSGVSSAVQCAHVRAQC